jgi:hypothetical protein
MNSVEVHSSVANGIPHSAHVSRTVTRIKKGVVSLVKYTLNVNVNVPYL